MKPLTYKITPCSDEVLKCQWLPVRELQLSPQANQLSNRIAELVLKGLREGFSQFDIGSEEWPYESSHHTYHLFLRRADNEVDK